MIWHAVNLKLTGFRYGVFSDILQQGIGNARLCMIPGILDGVVCRVLLTSPDYGWERVGFWVNEGPAFLVHGDRIFLTYSASAAGACYCMGMLSIDADGDLLDPRAWKKERFPVLRTDGEKGVFGPGHNSFVRAEDGTTDLCFYHARQYDEITGDPLHDPNRHTMVLALAYDNTGRPVFEIPKR